MERSRVSLAGVLAGVVVLFGGVAVARAGIWSGSEILISIRPGDLIVDVAASLDELTVRGLPAALLERLSSAGPEGATSPVLRVYTADADLSEPGFPAVAGSVERSEAALRFTPKYPLLGGHEYRVALDFSTVGGSFEGGHAPLILEVPTQDPSGGELSTVVALYPSGDLLPENQLKLYLHFSRPMRTWDPYEHVRLIQERTGEEVDAAFHAMRDGLWDGSGTRFTIVFDPGRVKRGLANRIEFGSPLVGGERYRLLVDSGWLDQLGRPMASGFERQFEVGPADRVRPAPKAWKIIPPRAGSTDPLVVRFPEPMDHALLRTFISVRTDQGSALVGEVEAAAHEREWRFYPTRPWLAGQSVLQIDSRIEDLAGNSVERLFDVDLTKAEQTWEPRQAEAQGAKSVVEVPFVIGSAAQDPTTDGGG